MLKNSIIVFIILSLIWVYVSACNKKESTQEIPAVTNFEVKKYLGDWYEIARLPHSFEKDMEYVKANYSLNPDGTIKVINSGIKHGKQKSIHGIAKFKGDHNIGNLEVSFFRPFWGLYKIIYLNSDYETAIVTSSTKNYLWLLSRTPQITEIEKNIFIEKATKWGFDTNNLIYPKQ
jgi:apolipoprotein D and lipocalin family protein